MNEKHLAVTGRRYDIDALRVLAFGLLIFYHVGMFYVADWHWHVKSIYLSEPLQHLMRLVNPWRMPLLFFISGTALHFMLERLSPAAFAWRRTKRLLIPLLFGMAVVIPPQAYLQALSNGSFQGDYAAFLWRYLTLQAWPPGAFDGSDPGVTWNHLWYLAYLLVYSLILALLLALPRRAQLPLLAQALCGMRGWYLVVVPALPFLLYEWVLRQRFPTTHALTDDWHSHAVFFTVFVMGYLFGSTPGSWLELRRLRWPLLTLAVSGYLWLILVQPVWSQSNTTGLNFLARLLPALEGWIWLLAVLGWGHHLLNRPFRWLPYATEAVFSWYILHQTITVVAGYGFGRLQLGPTLEPLLVLVTTILGCLLLHEYVVRRVNFLRPLFGLRARPAITAGTALKSFRI